MERPKKVEEAPEPTCTKVYYASRTHSQLSQVLHELRKLKIDLSGASIVSLHPSSHDLPSGGAKRLISYLEEEDELDTSEGVSIRTVSLGSRKQLCINEKLKAKAGDLDEACRQRLSGELKSLL